MKWKSSDAEADTLLKALALTDVDFFPNIKELLKIGCFAVTSAEYERSKVVDEFARRNPRRMELTYPIAEDKDD